MGCSLLASHIRIIYRARICSETKLAVNVVIMCRRVVLPAHGPEQVSKPVPIFSEFARLCNEVLDGSFDIVSRKVNFADLSQLVQPVALFGYNADVWDELGKAGALLRNTCPKHCLKNPLHRLSSNAQQNTLERAYTLVTRTQNGLLVPARSPSNSLP